jgi:DnaJ-class molecular chaperone
MAKRPKNRPNGGRGKRSTYKTLTMRVPLPLKNEVQALIDQFYRDNDLPLEGSWWEVLGISSPQQVSANEVKQAYRRLAMLFHPDRNLFSNASERFKAINKAYEASGFK